jgi:hypothetical protein
MTRFQCVPAADLLGNGGVNVWRCGVTFRELRRSFSEISFGTTREQSFCEREIQTLMFHSSQIEFLHRKLA